MAKIRREIRFLLNDQEVRLDAVGPNDTLIDFLRLDRRLRGTKEGCAEGDCGACTVLIGRLTPRGLLYEPITACIRLLPSLDRRHVVTIEALSAGGALHPIQKALADHHGSQCGFCTPGIVMALYAHWLNGGATTREAVETALQGNLCRCTGYAPILRAMAAVGDDPSDALRAGAAEAAARLAALDDGARVEAARAGERAILPADVDDLAEVLAETRDATIVAGGTDAGLWITKELRSIAPAVFVDHLTPLRETTREVGAIRIGGGVAYAELEPVLAERHPWMLDYWRRIGGAQVRRMGTIGGNIANGSPIGDAPPPLIALGATVELRSRAGRRSVPLEDFFLAYKRQDRRPDEFIEAVRAPDTPPGAVAAAYKVSKRRDQDISSVSAGFVVTTADGRITAARLAYGGMAATPKRARAAEAALIGAPCRKETFDAAAAALSDDFAPISDMRASAEYRAMVAGNLLRRFFLERVEGGAVRLTRGARAAPNGGR